MGKTVILKKKKLPDFLPHGWIGEVAKAMGIHRNSVYSALKRGKGEAYERVKMVAINKWGVDED